MYAPDLAWKDRGDGTGESSSTEDVKRQGSRVKGSVRGWEGLSDRVSGVTKGHGVSAEVHCGPTCALGGEDEIEMLGNLRVETHSKLVGPNIRIIQTLIRHYAAHICSLLLSQDSVRHQATFV